MALYILCTLCLLCYHSISSIIIIINIIIIIIIFIIIIIIIILLTFNTGKRKWAKNKQLPLRRRVWQLMLNKLLTSFYCWPTNSRCSTETFFDKGKYVTENVLV